MARCWLNSMLEKWSCSSRVKQSILVILPLLEYTRVKEINTKLRTDDSPNGRYTDLRKIWIAHEVDAK